MTQAFNLSQLANRVNSSGQIDAGSGLTGTLPIANGGTGTTSTTFTNLTTNVTGTLPTGNGGTGLTSTPTSGQIDIGNNTGFTRTTLTQGANVTITNGSGSITIAAAGNMVVDTNTSSGATTYTVGTTIFARSADGGTGFLDLNSAQTIYTDGTTFSTANIGSSLTGTWRCRGNSFQFGTGSEDVYKYLYLFQRTA
jgi:hypothetical protein